jgi:hypothetical protein
VVYILQRNLIIPGKAVEIKFTIFSYQPFFACTVQEQRTGFNLGKRTGYHINVEGGNKGVDIISNLIHPAC